MAVSSSLPFRRRCHASPNRAIGIAVGWAERREAHHRGSTAWGSASVSLWGRLASFETPASRAPQDEVISSLYQILILILRSAPGVSGMGFALLSPSYGLMMPPAASVRQNYLDRFLDRDGSCLIASNG